MNITGDYVIDGRGNAIPLEPAPLVTFNAGLARLLENNGTPVVLVNAGAFDDSVIEINDARALRGYASTPTLGIDVEVQVPDDDRLVATNRGILKHDDPVTPGTFLWYTAADVLADPQPVWWIDDAGGKVGPGSKGP